MGHRCTQIDTDKKISVHQCLSVSYFQERQVCLPNPSKRANKRIKPTAFGAGPRVSPCLRAWCCRVRYLARGGGGLYASRYAARRQQNANWRAFPAISFHRERWWKMEVQNEKTIDEIQRLDSLGGRRSSRRWSCCDF